MSKVLYKSVVILDIVKLPLVTIVVTGVLVDGALVAVALRESVQVVHHPVQMANLQQYPGHCAQQI